MHPIYRKSTIIFLATVLVRLLYHLFTGFVADDAFITYRYAENIAFGDGFVYNAGERVLGTSTPLFTLMLSFFRVLGVIPLTGSLMISLVVSGLTAVVLYRFAKLLRFTSWAFAPVLLYVLWPRSMAAETSGMETAFFTLLVTAAFYYQHRGLNYYAVALATLATLTRPEGLLLLIVLVVINCYFDRTYWHRYIAAPMVLLIPWLLFSQFYFGSIVPNSITAKLALYSRFGTESYLNNAIYVLGLHRVAGWLLLAAAAIGAWWLNRKQNFGGSAAAWLLGMVLFFTFSRTHLFFWYMVPIYPLFLLFASAAVLPVVERWLTFRVHVRFWSTGLASVLLIALVVTGYPQAVYYRNFQKHMENMHKKMGMYLYRNANRDSDVAALEDIGYSGYYSTLRILDRDGLVSPEMIPYNRAGIYLQAMLDLKPDWVGAAWGSPTSGFMTDSTFLSEYRMEKCFAYEQHPGYCLFRRIAQ